MSSATPSHPAPRTTDDRSIVTAWTDRFVYGVRATAFWSAAVLPLFLMAAIAAGTISQYPVAFAGVLLLNVACAVVGHEHTPGR